MSKTILKILEHFSSVSSIVLCRQRERRTDWRPNEANRRFLQFCKSL